MGAGGSVNVDLKTQLAAIRARPAWDDERERDAESVPPMVCSATDCDRPATAWLVARKLPYCGEHGQLLRQLGRLVVPLILCAFCRRQGPVELALKFRGEDVQSVCRDCAELVRELRERGWR